MLSVDFQNRFSYHKLKSEKLPKFFNEPMNVDIRLYATLTRFLPMGAKNKSCILDLPEPSVVGDVIKILGLPDKSVKLIFINGVHAALHTALKDGDRVGLFPPVGGG